MRWLTKPNGITLTQSYEEHRNLLTSMAYHRGTTLVAQREYVYDTLGRPTARNTARKGTVVNDTFAHNTRSELTAAQVNGENYQYNYDNIGNRAAAVEDSSGVASRTEYPPMRSTNTPTFKRMRKPHSARSSMLTATRPALKRKRVSGRSSTTPKIAR